jgi:hypothetical protein
MLTVLLGDQPALTPPERLYQRLLVGDAAEAETLAEEKIAESNLLAFYQDVAMPALRLAQADAQDATVPVDYLARLSSTLEDLAEDVDDHDLLAPTEDTTRAPEKLEVMCLGAKGWVDEASAIVTAHVMRKAGLNASRLKGEISRDGNRNLIIGPDTGPVFCVCTFSTATAGSLIRYAARRVQRQNPRAKFMACIWDTDAETANAIAARAEINVVATTLKEAMAKARVLVEVNPSSKPIRVPAQVTEHG